MTQPARAADTFLVSCIDPRLTDDTTFYFEALGRTDRYSEMRIAGAALAALAEHNASWSNALFENLAASRQLHGIRRVTFLNHRDCGAVHLWAGRKLSGDPAEEERVHADILNRAAEAVRARHPDLMIEIKLMDLDGRVRVLPCAACVPRGFRADAVDPVGQALAQATAGAGTVIEPGTGARNPARFADLARLRATSGVPDPEADLALLSRGVGEYGLTAEEAQQALASAARAEGSTTGPRADRDIVAFLRSRQDRLGRVAKQDVEQAGALYRQLAGMRVTANEAERHAARVVEAEGIGARPRGVWPFRSTAWLRRMAERSA